MIRRAFLLSSLSLGASATAFAKTLTPQAFVEKLYRGYAAIKPDEWTEPLKGIDFKYWMTPELYDLYQKGSTDILPEEMPILDWDVFVNGQDFLITEITCTTNQTDDTHMVVSARFKNFDSPTEVLYDFVKMGGRWRIDNIRYPATEDYPGGFSLKDHVRYWLNHSRS